MEERTALYCGTLRDDCDDKKELNVDESAVRWIVQLRNYKTLVSAVLEPSTLLTSQIGLEGAKKNQNSTQHSRQVLLLDVPLCHLFSIFSNTELS